MDYYSSSWHFTHIPSNIIAFDEKIYDTLTMQVLIIPTDAPFRLSHRQLSHPVLANQYHSLNYFWLPIASWLSSLSDHHIQADIKSYRRLVILVVTSKPFGVNSLTSQFASILVSCPSAHYIYPSHLANHDLHYTRIHYPFLHFQSDKSRWSRYKNCTPFL